MTTSGLLRPFDNWKKISWLWGHEFKLQYYTFFSFIISYLLLFTFSYFWFSYSLRKKIQKDFDKNIYAVPTQACLNIKAPFEHPRVMGLTGLGFDNMYDYFCLIFWFSFLPDKKIQFTLTAVLFLLVKLNLSPLHTFEHPRVEGLKGVGVWRYLWLLLFGFLVLVFGQKQISVNTDCSLVLASKP